ncbi:hypothetical protein HYPSUDRAFT_210050 [Hypholoma sublateritium FD-334 SS-4]|uniref:Uncharacterized protein n=1 Tax=Hypholoma sublateritium (strain FD-334 SS-4) TaxID=945553 RepID=A0A0D2KEA6_HYPSF|nr:hypothetical protein HYPSUDRAFT_210050 [Hypholoma sublateritium FD-334 SS-4]
MPPTTANATSRKRTSAQDPTPAPGRGNKAAKQARTGDAPTSLVAEEHPNSITAAATGDKENSRPVRSKAGKRGRNEQLEELLFHLRPDLNPDKQNTRPAQSSFPQNTPENEFAPQQGTRRTSRKNPQV